MKKTVITASIFFFFFLVQPVRMQAQNDDNEDDYPVDPGETDVPFDGGISLLLASAVAYAAKMGYDNNKEKSRQL